MSEKEEEPNQIEQIINALDYNLNSLEEARGMTMADVKDFFLDLLGTVRDMWERFKPFFEEMEKQMKIRESANKEGKDKKENDIIDTDIKSLYM